MTIINSCRSGQQILAGQVPYEDGLNAVTWDEAAIDSLQDAYHESTQVYFCGGGGAVSSLTL